MKLQMIDAVDAMNVGGYIDRETMDWIPPKWCAELNPKEHVVLSDSEYAQVVATPLRYLRVPVFRPTGIPCEIAQRMGMPRELLNELGMTKEEYWMYFQSPKENMKDRAYSCSEEEWAILDGIDKYMRSRKIYCQYLDEKRALMLKIIRNWLSEHGIEVE